MTPSPRLNSNRPGVTARSRADASRCRPRYGSRSAAGAWPRAQAQAPARPGQGGGRGHKPASIPCCRSARRFRILPAGRGRQDPQEQRVLGARCWPSSSRATTALSRSFTKAGSRSSTRTTSRKGVTLVAINPNNPKTVRLDELGYTDVTDSLPEMKIRASFRGLDVAVSLRRRDPGALDKFGAVATPHIFLFDQERKLRYQGRIDDNQREELVKTQRRARCARRHARGPSSRHGRDDGVRMHHEVDEQGLRTSAGVGEDSRPSR